MFGVRDDAAAGVAGNVQLDLTHVTLEIVAFLALVRGRRSWTRCASLPDVLRKCYHPLSFLISFFISKTLFETPHFTYYQLRFNFSGIQPNIRHNGALSSYSFDII